MAGSLQIKGDKYYAVVYTQDARGNKRQKWISTGISVSGSNKRYAQKVVKDIITEYENSRVIYSSEIPFCDWLAIWIEQRKPELELITWEAYNSYVVIHISPYFKKLDVSLYTLTPQHIQDYYSEKLKSGTDGRAPLSANSLRKHHVVIRGALEDALKKNLIPYNPADRVTLPKTKRFDGGFYSVETANKLLAVTETDPLRPAIILALFYGLRRSEVLGLKWDAIDFKNNTLIIRNTVVRGNTLVEKERTKTKKSYRTLPLIPEVKEYLQKLLKQQADNRLVLGSEYSYNGHICVWPDGRPLSTDYVSKHFAKILKDKNLPPIRFHDLRHTTASLLLAKGFGLKEIQDWLGHHDLATTADIYSHFDYKEKVKIANGMGEILSLASNN